MHLQKTALLAICVSLVCLVHSAAAADNPELQEGLRKRASSQPSTSQFDDATLTKHLMCTQEIEESVAREKRERQKEEEDSNAVLNRGIEWAAKNQARIFKTVLVVAGLGVGIWILSQLILFADAEAAAISHNSLAERLYLKKYPYKHSSLIYKDVIIAGEQLAEEAEEELQENEEITDTVQTMIETATWEPYTKEHIIYKDAAISREELEEAEEELQENEEITGTMQTMIETAIWEPYTKDSSSTWLKRLEGVGLGR
ncbi:hypothetical protein NECID01_0354 [Nematocida sp. AWRm77]|nr:hypothetical protein NECID01_0354 [Nematocida sp. AWRm77]